MISLAVLGISILLQLAAAAMALRLVRTTGWVLAWLLIAFALLMMGARRSITFYNAISGESAQPPDLTTELVALLISIAMLSGVALIRPIFVARRKAEAALQESEATYRGILDNMTDTFYRTDSDGRIVIASESATELLGYSMDELIGKPLAELYSDPSQREEFLQNLKEAGGQFRGFVVVLRRKDAEPIIVETNARLIQDTKGKILGVEGTARDITIRRRAEELNTRLGRIIEDSVNEIYVFDSTTLKFISVNRGARDNLGYTMAELQEMTPVDIKPELSVENFLELIEPIQNGTRNDMSFETVHARKDGSTYSVLVSLQLTRSESPPVYFAIIQDTTQRNEVEAKMLVAKENAEQANRAKSEFLAHFSHELRTPLNAIIGFSELLQQEIFGPLGNKQYTEYAGDIHHSGEHLLEMITDILEFSRIEAGQLEHVEKVFDARKVVEECVRLISSRAKDRGVTIEQQRSDAGLWLNADERMLRQMLLNLLTNAVKFTRQNTVVTLKAEMGEGGGMNFIVSDCGEGMVASDIERIQEPFIRLQGAQTSSEEGSGLGLAITKRLVESHGGSLRLSSEVGVGTTASICIPHERVTNKTP